MSNTPRVVESGTITGHIPAGSNVLSDRERRWAADIHKNRIVMIEAAPMQRHERLQHTFLITSNSNDSLSLASPALSEIPQGSTYEIIDFDINSILSSVFGVGGNVDLLGILSPIEKGVIHNAAYVAGNDFFAADLAPTNTPCLFRVFVSMDAQGVLSATITNGGSVQTMYFNRNVGLMADCMNMFDILVHGGDTVNLQYSVNANIEVCRVQEIIVGVQ